MFRCLFAALLLLTVAATAQQRYAVIATNADPTLIPEGIAVDSRTHTIYVSSINHRKIVAVDMAGKTKDFTAEAQDGFLGGLGMTIDTVRNWLWATSILQEGKLYSSKVHAFDLKTGKTMQQYTLKDTNAHVLNDLTVVKGGGIYITDTYYGAIYHVNPATKQFSLFLKAGLIAAPNGIVAAGNHLIIATYVNGLVDVDYRTKTIKRVGGIKDTVVSHGLDGLVLHDRQLFGVLNIYDDPAKNLVVQYSLNGGLDSVVSEAILDQGNRHFREPTTIAYSEGKLYALANSYIGEYNKNKSSTKGIEQQLSPVTIVVYPFQGKP